jgi:hypothetical protein
VGLGTRRGQYVLDQEISATAGSERLREVYVPPEMLSDLHDPRLVITPDYVGRDRRRPGIGRGRPARGGRPSLRLRDVVTVALVTAAAVVPLTLIASQQAPQSMTTGKAGHAVRATADGRTRRSPHSASRAVHHTASVRVGARVVAPHAPEAAAARSARVDAAEALRGTRRAARQLASYRAATLAQARLVAHQARLAARSDRSGAARPGFRATP